jgi:hypothetical protein
MTRRLFRISLVSASAAVLIAGCAAPPPYVYLPQEFNRTASDFGKEPLNIDSVTICYNKFGTNPGLVANMASAECAKFNKKAEFRRQRYDQCSLFVPVAAVYACVGGTERNKGLSQY